MDSYKSLMPGAGHDMSDEPRVVPGLEGFTQRSNLPNPWNIYQFYSSNSDPWVPRHTIPQDDPQFPAKPNSFSPTSALPAGHYAPSRSNAAHDYTVSDSGYESRAKKSAENTSLFEGMDRSQDARSVTGRMADFHPFGVAAPEQFVHSPASQRDYRQQQWVPQNAPQESRSSLAASGLWCRTCSKPVKNKSELKKHDQRHNKPHKCDVPGCNRKEGFSTTNDLDRHKRSVHSAEGIKFRCPFGLCGSKEKTWPRADNFRSHLRRVHNHAIEADGDLSDFMIGTPQTATPERPAPAFLQGVGSMMDYTDIPSVTGQPWYDTRPPADLDMSEASPISVPVSVSFPTQQCAEDANGTDLALTQPRPCIGPTMNHPPRPSLMTSNCQANAGSSVNLSENVLPSPRQTECLSNSVAAPPMSAPTEIALAETAQEAQRIIESPKTTTETPEAVVDEPLSVSSEDADDQTTSHEEGDNLPSENEAEGDDDGEDEGEEEEPSIESSSETQPEKPDEAAFLRLLKDVPSDILDKFLKDRKIEMSKNAKSNATTPAETHPCKKCKKVFARACELKKHLKRHSKPYGCTFVKCDRRFGSKNDWKRHENSQHMQLETWKCHEPTSEGKGAICGKVFSRREQFKNHLSTHHSISDTVKLDKELQERRIGRNGDSSFWCGFCVKIVQLSKEPHSWTERFNHIDDHFCGKKGQPQQDIADWQFLDDSEAVDGSSSSGPSSDESSSEDLVAPKPDPALPEPSSAPMSNKKRSAEDDILPEAKRNRG